MAMKEWERTNNKSCLDELIYILNYSFPPMALLSIWLAVTIFMSGDFKLLDDTVLPWNAWIYTFAVSMLYYLLSAGYVRDT